MATFLGIVGLLLIAISWQFKRRETILKYNAAAFVFFSLQLYVLEAFAGSALMVVAIIYTLVSIYHQNARLIIFFVLVNMGAGLWFYQSPIDVLPTAANVMGVLAFFSKSVVALRLLSPIGTVLWGIHNFWVGAYSQVLADILILSSMALGWYRTKNLGTTNHSLTSSLTSIDRPKVTTEAKGTKQLEEDQEDKEP